MKYYAIRNKETKLYLTINYLTGQFEYTSKELNPYLLKDEGGANIYTKGDNSVEAIPVELKEVIDDPQEQAREYCVKALSDNRVYLPIKESKPKWYEIRPTQIVRLDRVEEVNLFTDKKEVGEEWGRPIYKDVWKVSLACGRYDYKTDDLTEEEATAKYNELKKLLEEV